MRIGVEASRANRAQRTGVEWYALHLMRELARLPEAADHRWLAYTNRRLRPDLKALIPAWEERVLRWPPYYLWTQLRLSREMQLFPPDVLFMPCHSLPRLYPKKTFVAVHDVGFRRFPKLYKPIQIAYHEISTRDIVRSSATILTVSAFSKQELVEQYHASPEQIRVTPLGVDLERYRPQSFEERGRVREKYQLKTPFLLFIGRLEDRKNIHRLVQAFCEAASSLPEGLMLVLAGPTGHGWRETVAWMKKHPQASRIRVLGYLAESDKPALISAAMAYIQPSVYEGFGLPLLEAFACGTPALAADIPALREVAGEVPVSFFDPYDLAAIATAIRAIAYLSSEQRAESRETGLHRVQTYQWHRTAELTYQAFLS